MNRKQQTLNLELLFNNPERYDIIVIGGQEAKMLQKTSLMMIIANYL